MLTIRLSTQISTMQPKGHNVYAVFVECTENTLQTFLFKKKYEHNVFCSWMVLLISRNTASICAVQPKQQDT